MHIVVIHCVFNIYEYKRERQSIIIIYFHTIVVIHCVFNIYEYKRERQSIIIIYFLLKYRDTLCK